MLADLPNHCTSGSTILADILVSGGPGSKPDLVIINRRQKIIALFELTCPLQSNIANAHQNKKVKYTQLEVTLTELGYDVHLVPFEVSSNGHLTQTNKRNIINTLKRFNVPRLEAKIFSNLATISLLYTMSIFYAYQTKEWTDPTLLSP